MEATCTPAFASARPLTSYTKHAAYTATCVRRPRQVRSAPAPSWPAMTSTARRAAPDARVQLPRPAGNGEVGVRLTRPKRDTRHVRANVLVHAPIDVVWRLLTDYGALARHVPNLAESTVLPVSFKTPNVAARVRQAGAQRILGFEFRAAVTLDMHEVHKGDERAVHFRRAPDDAGDFQCFHGTWSLRAAGDDTELHYDVTLSPRGLVPVAAIEWRIGEDVPANVDAVRKACERRHRNALADARRARARKQQ